VGFSLQAVALILVHDGNSAEQASAVRRSVLMGRMQDEDVHLADRMIAIVSRKKQTAEHLEEAPQFAV
jgi:hypothetical protein